MPQTHPIMTRPVYAAYDLGGIQGFIFDSGRMAQNAGGDLLLKTAFDESIAAARSALEDAGFHDSFQPHFIGAGNAFVEFADRAHYVAFNRVLYEQMHRRACGLRVLTACTEKTGHFANDEARLYEGLDRHKASYRGILAHTGFSVDRMDDRNRPIILNMDMLSAPEGKPVLMARAAFLKQAAAQEDRSWAMKAQAGRYDALLPGVAERNALNEGARALLEGISTLRYNRDLATLAGASGERSLAIVHIDGNQVGKSIRLLMDTAAQTRPNDPEAALRFKKLRVYTKFEGAFRMALAQLTVWVLENRTALSMRGVALGDPEQADTLVLPVVPVIFGGDDITLACDARVAFPFTVMLLEAISRRHLVEQGDDLADTMREIGQSVPFHPLSACAGVCLCKAHYPFADAYMLAERAMERAKAASRNAQGTGWMDFIQALNETDPAFSDLDRGARTGYALSRRPYLVTEPGTTATMATPTMASLAFSAPADSERPNAEATSPTRWTDLLEDITSWRTFPAAFRKPFLHAYEAGKGEVARVLSDARYQKEQRNNPNYTTAPTTEEEVFLHKTGIARFYDAALLSEYLPDSGSGRRTESETEGGAQ